MHDLDQKRREEVALFRYGVIADLVHLEPGAKGLYARLREKSEQTYDIPFSRRSRVAAETIRDWLKLYRKGGFDALLPKPRKDVGQARGLPQKAADLLVHIKEENPALTVRQVISTARATGEVAADVALAHSTVHRLLARHGLTDPRRRTEAPRERRRFAFQRAGELWMSDVMHGPAVVAEGRRKRKTYLIAFLDDATRVIPYAAFAHSENTAAFLPVLKAAVMRRGLPQRLYVDNGAAYRSKHLALVCAKLGITLIHARPYDAAAKGKQERWFRTVRMQLLPLLNGHDLSSLEALNRRLWAWVEGEYHHAPHRGLDRETPLDRWAQVGGDVRYPGPDMDLEDLFLFEARRRVHKDRTVSLDGVVYEVEPHLVGSTVTLRYDPQRLGRSIQVWLDGRRMADAKVVDAYANCFVRRGELRDVLVPDRTPDAPPAGLSLRDLREKGEA